MFVIGMRRILAGMSMACAIAPALAATPTWAHRLIAAFPHDTTAWTEGLLVSGDHLIESDGVNGQSQITVTQLRSSHVLLRRNMSADDYAEGIALVGTRLVQLTWIQQLGHVYDLALHPLGNFHYSGEGWGLAYDGRRLIMSNGSDTLRFLRADGDFAELGRLAVRDGDQPIAQMNELEYVDGLVYANIWHTDRVAVIDANSGAVRAWLDFTDLHELVSSVVGWDFEGKTLNGIAYDPASRHFFITGKYWPKIFEVEVLGEHAKP
jgi:glutamine cyclotransferase